MSVFNTIIAVCATLLIQVQAGRVFLDYGMGGGIQKCYENRINENDGALQATERIPLDLNVRLENGLRFSFDVFYKRLDASTPRTDRHKLGLLRASVRGYPEVSWTTFSLNPDGYESQEGVGSSIKQSNKFKRRLMRVTGGSTRKVRPFMTRPSPFAVDERCKVEQVTEAGERIACEITIDKSTRYIEDGTPDVEPSQVELELQSIFDTLRDLGNHREVEQLYSINGISIQQRDKRGTWFKIFDLSEYQFAQCVAA